MEHMYMQMYMHVHMHMYMHLHMHVYMHIHRTGRYDIGKIPKRSYAKPLPRAVIFLQNRFRSPKRCSYHPSATQGWPV